MKKAEKIICLVLLIVVVLAAVFLAVRWSMQSSNVEADKPTQTPGSPVIPETQVIYQEVEKIVEKEKLVEVEKVFTSQIIQEGLNDLSFLVTSEYYFTEVMSHESVNRIFDIPIPLTKSTYLATYDGVVTAGVDFSRITVVKDNDSRSIVISMPQAEIQNVTIDNNSFQVYYEKEGLGNPTRLENYNESVKDLKAAALNRAKENGVLERAQTTAQSIVKNFLASLVDLHEFTVLFTVQ